MNNLVNSADVIGLFCRLHMNMKMDIPIRPSQMGVLIFIQREESLVTPLAISQFLKMTKPAVSTILKALEEGDYIKKEPIPEDGRSYRLKITALGEALVKETFKEYLKTVELLQKGMGEENFHQFIELMHLANSVLHQEENI